MDDRDKFLKNGWFKVLIDAMAVHKIKRDLEEYLSKVLVTEMTLENYHIREITDRTHLDITSYLRERAGSMVKEHLIKPFLIYEIKSILGPDLFIQKEPYLRITRPGINNDNIGIHRDTSYGGSPYEVSCIIPFTDMDYDCGFSVISGSHLKPESYYKYEEVKVDIEKGSEKHKLGFPYAPKLVKISSNSLERIKINMGEVLVFSLALVHGSKVNKSKCTRWSMDLRFVNTFAPKNKPEYYEELTSSTISQAARQYLNG